MAYKVVAFLVFACLLAMSQAGCLSIYTAADCKGQATTVCGCIPAGGKFPVSGRVAA